MKKRMTFILTVLLLLVAICSSSYANTIVVTKENLKEGIEKVISANESDDGMLLSEMTDDTIILENAEGSIRYNINYTLQDKPEFSIDLKFTEGITKEEYEEEIGKMTIPAWGFMGVAHVAGQDVTNAMFYFIGSIVMNEEIQNILNLEGYTDAISMAQESFDKDIVITDELYTLTLKKVNQTDSEYIVRAIMQVNTDENFSVIQEYMDNIQDEFVNSIGGMINDVGDGVANDDTLANIEEIPQSGRNFGLIDVLQIVIFTSIVMLVIFIIKDKKTKLKG